MSLPADGQPVSRLSRQLDTADAVVIGLGSMIGAGVFVVLGPAAAAAGSGLLLGLPIAAVVAYCNAASSAQLAAVHPRSGGTYVYGREQLGHGWGFLAGWSFVVGKTASCAAMALTFATYVAPGSARPVAIGAVVVLTVVNLSGVRKTARLTQVVVAVVLSSLAVVVGVGIRGGLSTADLGSMTAGGARGVLESAGLIFFAFAGYARIATLGEEVRDPQKVIPRAIPLALGITLAVYAVVAVVALLAVGPHRLGVSPAPLVTVVRASGADWAIGVVRVGAAVASLGVLLSLLVGVSRTTFAMAGERDLPGWLDAVEPRHSVPLRAEIAVAVVVIAVLTVADVRGAIGFSAFTVLTYYAIANASARTLPREARRRPRGSATVGLAGCVLLALMLPARSVIGGVTCLLIGAGIWAVRHGH